ncbi:MAG TPA: GspH/FimT family pseudopilin [Steroidobacteraceae bacterium]|nr:GspH/FimT family pseudopilin [Steroidobacteraceae bacterium]
MRGSQGVTLLELAFAMAIVAVLIGLAVPGVRELRLDSERTAAVNDLLHALYLARSEAIKRGAVVSVCPGTAESGCAPGTEWAGGWLVFVNDDRDRPPELDPGELVLRADMPAANLTITSNRPALSFRPTTQLDVNGTIVFCDPRGSDAARAIIVSHTGRPRVSTRNSSGRPLSCPGDSP